MSNPNPTPPPKDKQFGQPNGNPRHNGAWKKEDTPRYKLEQMMKLSEAELIKIYEDKDAPLFEKKLARAIKDGKWREIESMINQVYGTPKQTIEQNVKVDPLEQILNKFGIGEGEDARQTETDEESSSEERT